MDQNAPNGTKKGGCSGAAPGGRGRLTRVRALGLGLGDAFQLPLATQFVSNCAKTPSMSEALGGRGLRVDRLFGRLERGTLGPDRPHNVLKITNGARQPVDPRHH
jgi:hypothetical protein